MNRHSRIQIPGEIHLADEPELVAGTMIVRPATLEILFDGRRETIEAKMMQVLVALARERGQVVSRDSLVMSCWSGRVVSDDAINRCVAKVRRLAGGTAGFKVETINRVGYRLVETVPGNSEAPPPTVTSADPPAPRPNRRLFLGAGAAAVVAATTGFFILGRGGDSTAPPPDVAPLMTQARIALNQCSPEGVRQAIGLLRRVVETRPDYAEGWATLSLTYAVRAGGMGSTNFEDASRHARSAAQRALQLDARSSFATAALALLEPQRGHWAEVERGLGNALADRPREEFVSVLLGVFLMSVGRSVDAVATLDAVGPAAQPSPAFLYTRAYALWGAGRLDEADQAIERVSALYPTHAATWFVHFYMMLSSGRVEEAIRFAENVDGRPNGIPADDFENMLVVARAMQSHNPADVDRAIARNRAAALRGLGYAQNTILFMAILGRLDDAFAAANDFYFGPASARGGLRFSAEQGQYVRAGETSTTFLFLPMAQAMRSDPRFGRLTAAIGLDRYWAESGHQPDYRRINS